MSGKHELDHEFDRMDTPRYMYIDNSAVACYSNYIQLVGVVKS